MKQLILKIINSYNFELKEGRFIETKVWTDIFTYSSLKSTNIAKNKLVTLVHGTSLTDEILLLIQNGMTEKDSVILTENFISIAESNWFSKNVLTKILWSDILNIQFINHSLIFNLKNGEIQNFDIDRVFNKNKEKANSLVELLQRILKITNGEKETIVKINNSKIDLQKHKKLIVFLSSILILGIGLLIFFLANQSSNPQTTNYPIQVSEKNNLPKFDTIWSDVPKKDFTKIIKFKTINIFNEPYEITMEAHKIIGLIHTGGDKIIIPIEIPENTIYWIYRMQLTNARIASGENPKLISEVDSKTKTWSILGSINPLEKTEIVTNLSRELINKVYEPRKDKPFTNAYFISTEKEAKKFQDGLEFKYDINNSIKNTHSRNGLIKFNENKFVYIGLDNEGYSDNIYVTLEAVSLIEYTRYYKIVKK